MLTVDLNADLGEIDNRTSEALMQVVSSTNISCGVHAGDPLLMLRTLNNADRNGVVAGAHPSYPDRDNFGRKSMFLGPSPAMTDTELHAVIDAQLSAFASMTGGVIAYIKPHGALYNDAQSNEKVARIVAYQADKRDAAVMGQPGSWMERVCVEYGIRFIAEVFADRGYEHNGTLITRGLPKSVHTNPDSIARRVVQMVTEKTVTTWGFNSETRETREEEAGTFTFSAVDSICLHGDTPGAYDIARAVRAALESAGVTIASPLGVNA